MSVDPASSLGERVAYFRRRLGLSQVELAARIGRSESWLSQVERGVRSVDRLSVLTLVAQALDVAVTELSPESTAEPEAPDPSGGASYLDELRLLLSGHPAVAVALGTARPKNVRVTEVRRQAALAWELTHASRYQEAAALFVDVVPRAESAIRAASDDKTRELRVHLVNIYLALSAVLAKLDEWEGSWLAAERAAALAEAVADPALLAATQYRLALGLSSAQYVDQARRVAEHAIEALTPLVRGDDAALLSMWGGCHLVLAVLASREGQRQEVRRLLQVARETAARVGEGANHFESEFGPANVELHAVSVAVELGDAGEALDLAGRVDTSQLSGERRAHLQIEVARAYVQLRRPADALQALEDAEARAPEQVGDHAHVREAVRELLLQAGRRASPGLRALAERIGVLG